MKEKRKEKRVHLLQNFYFILSLVSRRGLSQDTPFFTFEARLFQLYFFSKSQCISNTSLNSYRDIQKTTLDITLKWKCIFVFSRRGVSWCLLLLLLCSSVPVEINHSGLPESKGGSKIIPFNKRGQCWSFAWNQQTMRKSGEGFDTGHHPEPTYKHSL